MKLLREACASTLGLPSDTFIYNIVCLQSSVSNTDNELYFVASSSNDVLSLFSIAHSGSKYSIKVRSSVKNAHKGLSCLQVASLDSMGSSESKNSVLSAGRDGIVKVWTLRNASEFSESIQLRAPRDAKHQGFSAIAQSGPNNLVAAGTELENDGPGDVSVYIWKLENSNQTQYPVLAFNDSHTDTITSLEFQPTVMQTGSSAVNLVSSSTDGLINVFDLDQEDEDEAVLSVINNRSAVQYFVCINGEEPFSQAAAIWTISQDEKLAFHSLREQETSPHASVLQQAEPQDMRETLQCDYVISMRKFTQDPGNTVITVGSYKSTEMEPRVDLYFYPESLVSPVFQPELRLLGAHGEEVVRDVWYTQDSALIVTCGEDGHVRAWLEGNTNPKDAESFGDRARDVKKKAHKITGASDARYRPY